MDYLKEFENTRFGLVKIEYDDFKMKLDFLYSQVRLIEKAEYECLAHVLIVFKKKSVVRKEVVNMINRLYGSAKIKGQQERLNL